jgi:hypothetical protein
MKFFNSLSFLRHFFFIFRTLFQGRKYRRISLTSKDDPSLLKLRQLCEEGRSKMIENLADVDDTLADKVLADDGEGYDGISPEMLEKVNIDQTTTSTNA